MFQFSLITVLVFRVLLCPIFCAAGCDVVCAEVEKSSCNCSQNNSSQACENVFDPKPSESPGNCPVPCDSSCICKGTHESQHRGVVVFCEQLMELLPAVLHDVDVEKPFSIHYRWREGRPDLLNGQSVRLVFSSLTV